MEKEKFKSMWNTGKEKLTFMGKQDTGKPNG